MATSPNITSFSGTSGTNVVVDGYSAEVQNANRSWSLTEPDPNTLRFSVQSGDYWSTSGWSDLTNDGGANRSEIEFPHFTNTGTQLNVSYGLDVEPGPVNNASFVNLGHLDSNDPSAPSPVDVELDQSDHMQVVIQTPSKSWILLYQDPNPIVRGHTYQMDLQMKMDPTGNTGFVNVWRDGVEIASYHGQVGSAVGSQYYWKEGIYRGGSSQTMTADFSNTQITTGSAPTPTSTTGTTSGSTTGTTSGGTRVTDLRGTTSSGGTTTSSGGTSRTGTTRPTLTVADHYLSVSPGGRVPLGIGVTAPSDGVSLNISGLPKYESITDSAGQTFRGRSVTLPAGDVNNLSLSSSYGGNGRPTATLTIRATDASGAPVTNGTQTITVKDPPLSTGTTTSGSGTSRTPVSGWSSGLADQHGGSQFQAINGIQWFDQHPGFARVARTLGEAGASQSDTASGPGTGAGARAFALLNQMMAGDFEGTSHFAQGTTTSSASSQQQSHFLTRPLH